MPLLVMGRSIKESRDTPHRYRLREKQFAPKFGSVKKQGAVESGLQSVFSHPAEAAVLKKSVPATGPARSEKPESAVSRPKPMKSPGFTRLTGFVWKHCARFFQKSNGPAEKRISRPRVVTGNGKPFQEELSLDAVKVIRNDLTEADLEVVAIKNSPSGGQQEFIGPAPGQRAETSAVGKVTSRLLAVLHL